MSRLPRVTSQEALAAVRRDGWQEVRSRGGHIQLKHATKPGRVTIPVHTGKVIPLDILSSIIKQAGLTADQFIKLL